MFYPSWETPANLCLGACLSQLASDLVYGFQSQTHFRRRRPLPLTVVEAACQPSPTVTFRAGLMPLFGTATPSQCTGSAAPMRRKAQVVVLVKGQSGGRVGVLYGGQSRLKGVVCLR